MHILNIPSDTVSILNAYFKHSIRYSKYNITSACAVDREFFDIYLSLWLPLGVFGPPLAPPGPTWGSFCLFGEPLDSLWAPVVPFGVPLGSLWPAFGIPLAILGHLEPS